MEVKFLSGASQKIEVNDLSQVGEARRLALSLAQSVGMDETKIAEAGIIATEAAGNMAKHAGGGQLITRDLSYGQHRGLEILAIDSGPGIADIEQSRQDGYSTAGSPGTGMGAMERIADFFDIHSAVQKGTVVVARLWQDGAAAGDPFSEHGVVCLPIAGEEACGDNWAIRQHGARMGIMMVDGIGHGLLASEAARRAIDLFTEQMEAPPLEIIKACHLALAGTRGAAMAAMECVAGNKVAHFAGVGNISGMLFDGEKVRGLASYNGTVGFQTLRAQQMSYPMPQTEGLLIMHSDGLNTRWKLEDYRGLRYRHPALIAGVLYRDFRRDRDDVTVLVTRVNAHDTADFIENRN